MKENITIKKGTEKYVRKYIPNFVFYIPFVYYGLVRMGTGSKFLGFVIYYILPTYYYFLYLSQWTIESFYLYPVLLLSMFNLYEIGYIHNDTETIKHEDNPSLRLYGYNINYYEFHKYSIYGIRLGLALLFSMLIIRFSGNQSGALFFVSLCFTELLIFLLYNSLRGAISLYVFALLQIIKYESYIFFFYPDINYMVFTLIILVYPIPNFIERLSFKRYNLSFFMNLFPDKSCFSAFRFYYYFCLVMLLVVLQTMNFMSFSAYAIFVFMALYRGLLLIITNKYKFKNYLQ